MIVVVVMSFDVSSNLNPQALAFTVKVFLEKLMGIVKEVRLDLLISKHIAKMNGMVIGQHDIQRIRDARGTNGRGDMVPYQSDIVILLDVEVLLFPLLREAGESIERVGH